MLFTACRKNSVLELSLQVFSIEVIKDAIQKLFQRSLGLAAHNNIAMNNIVKNKLATLIKLFIRVSNLG